MADEIITGGTPATETPAAAAAPGEQNPPVTAAGEPGSTVDTGIASGVVTGDEAAASTTGAPESYADFTLPEGVTLDAAELEALKAEFKELGLSQEQAQKALTLQAQRYQAGQQAQVDAINQLRDEWVAAAQADSEIGGDKWDESVSQARLAVQKFGTQGLNDLFKKSGIGNHPEVIRVFSRVGALLKEDRPTASDTSVGTAKPKSREEIMYPQK